MSSAPFVKPINALLKETRKSKGISLVEAYQETKIHPHVLEALEEGTPINLSPLYVRSYIKLYAKFLGISQKDLDSYFHPMKTTSTSNLETSRPVVKTPPTPKATRRPRIDIGADERTQAIREVVLTIARFIRDYKNIIGILFVFFLIILLLPRLGSHKQVSPASGDSSAALQVRTVSVPPSQETPAQKTTPAPVVEAVTKQPASVSQAALSTGGLQLAIFAEQETWLQVKADDEVIFRQILKKSSTEVWHARESFELRLSNAGAVKLELNGKILPSIGRRGQSLRRVVITKDGIAIKQ